MNLNSKEIRIVQKVRQDKTPTWNCRVNTNGTFNLVCSVESDPDCSMPWLDLPSRHGIDQSNIEFYDSNNNLMWRIRTKQFDEPEASGYIVWIESKRDEYPNEIWHIHTSEDITSDKTLLIQYIAHEFMIQESFNDKSMEEELIIFMNSIAEVPMVRSYIERHSNKS